MTIQKPLDEDLKVFLYLRSYVNALKLNLKWSLLYPGSSFLALLLGLLLQVRTGQNLE